jgi:hypothetical protein
MRVTVFAGRIQDFAYRRRHIETGFYGALRADWRIPRRMQGHYLDQREGRCRGQGCAMKIVHAFAFLACPSGIWMAGGRPGFYAGARLYVLNGSFAAA